MVYQISEKNQIFIALFAIVVLCAGKLFKDYLFRRGYVEGLTNGNFILSMVADGPLSRPAPNTANRTVNVYFKIKMPQTATVVKVELPNDVANGGANDITLSTNTSHYTIVSVNSSSGATTAITQSPVYTDAAPGTPPIVRSISFTASTPITSDTIIQIGVQMTLFQKSQPTEIETFGPFKVIIGSALNDVYDSRSITIAPNSGGSTTVSSGSVVEIQNAINTIRTRLNTMGPSDQGRTELLQAQSALVTVLAYTYGTVKEAGKVFDSEALYRAQQTAMEFINREKARAASNATALKEDNANKRRMAQVNTYYTRNYEANTEVMKNIIFVSIALIILAILRNKDLIPSSISTLGVIFVLTLGGIVIGTQVFDIIRRNDHDFDKYDWTFNEKEHDDKKFIQQNSDKANLLDSGMAACYGPGCCSVGTTWNPIAAQCMPGAGGSVSGTAGWDPATKQLAIILTVPGGLSIAASGIPADSVTITLPSGLFSGTPAVSGSEYSGSPTLSGQFILTKTSSTISPNPSATTTITITGMTVAPNAYQATKKLTVKTSKDINLVGIAITGIS